MSVRFGVHSRAIWRSPCARSVVSHSTATSMDVSWNRVQQVYNDAQASGTASKLDTRDKIIEDQGVPFVVRIASALKNKPKGPGNEKPAGGGKDGAPPPPPPKFRNPFLPPEESMYIGRLSDTHSLLLNKFNVVEHHTLVVTTAYESQNDPLNGADLEATVRTLGLYPGGALAYFNCGEASGRSQPHKHLQVVPLPLHPSLPRTPFGPTIQAAVSPLPPGHPAELRALPFRAYASTLAPEDLENPTKLEAAFRKLFDLSQAGPATPAAPPPPVVPEGMPRVSPSPRASYNFILAKDKDLTYMLIVPRSKESCGPISVNSMGFAGTVLVRSEAELGFVEGEGPMRILAETGMPW